MFEVLENFETLFDHFVAGLVLDVGDHADAAGIMLVGGVIKTLGLGTTRHAAAVFDQAPGEVVEQFGMGRLVARRAEVVRRADDSPAEVMLPDAVDDDARDDGRLLRIDHLLGELQSPAAGGYTE